MCSQPQYKEPGAAIRGNTGHGCCCEGTSGRWVALSALILGAIREHCTCIRNITVPLIYGGRGGGGYYSALLLGVLREWGPSIRNITVPLIHGGGNYNAPLLGALWEQNSSIRSIMAPLMGSLKCSLIRNITVPLIHEGFITGVSY